MGDLDQWIDRLASDNYPIDAVLYQVLALAQARDVPYPDILNRVCDLRVTRLIETCVSGSLTREPLLWVPIGEEIQSGDTFDWRGTEQRAYCIRTDTWGVRRARIAPLCHFEGEPYVEPEKR